MREGCRQCSFTQTSEGVLVGAEPCFQNVCEGGLPQGGGSHGFPSCYPGVGPVPSGTCLWPSSSSKELGLISPLKADTAPPGPPELPWPLSANQRQAGPSGPGPVEKKGCMAASLPQAGWWGWALPGDGACEIRPTWECWVNLRVRVRGDGERWDLTPPYARKDGPVRSLPGEGLVPAIVPAGGMGWGSLLACVGLG